MGQQWQAIILAGDRGADDPVATAGQASCKASAVVGKQMLVANVFDALMSATCIDSLLQCGPAREQIQKSVELSQFIESNTVRWIAPESSPSRSAKSAVSQVNEYPVLLITSDLPLVSSEHIDAFCKEALRSEADIVACAIPHEQIKDKIPELKKTRYQFAQQALCFANVFALRTERSTRALEFWKQVEDVRKQPLKIVSMLGAGSLLRYKTGRLTLTEAAARLSNKTGVLVDVVTMSIPELAIDVDSADDYEIMSRFCQE